MSNAALLDVDPQPGGIDRFLFDHARDHDLLAQTTSARINRQLTLYILDPLNAAQLRQWLLDHQKAHDDLVAVTGVIGNDLQTVDFADPHQRDAWLQLNAQEHDAFHAALGI